MSSAIANDSKGLASGGQGGNRVSFATTNIGNGIVETPSSASTVLSTSVANSKAQNAAILGEASALVQRQRAKGESVLVRNTHGNRRGHRGELLSMSTGLNVGTSNVRRRDHVYTHELARRAVALVATNIGVGDCTSETLDVMGDALIEFLSKFGEIMANNAEISNRPSSHCNIYDALYAAEVLMSQPAAQQMTVALEGTDDDAAEGVLATAAIAGGGALHVASIDGTIKPHITQKNDDKQSKASERSEKLDIERMTQSMCKQNGWESIAEFAFGPKWFEVGRRAMRNDDDYATNNYSSPAAKKIASPRSTGDNKSNGKPSVPKGKSPEDKSKSSILKEGVSGTKTGHADEDESQLFLDGWNAPYPDLVASYPIRKKIKMNFAPVSLIEEACFEQHTSSIKDSLKKNSSSKNVTASDKEADDPKKKKRQSSKKKVQDNTTKGTSENKDEGSSRLSAYQTLPLAHPFDGPIPPWCPPFPPSFTFEPLERKPDTSHQDTDAVSMMTPGLAQKLGTAMDYGEVRKNLVAIQKVEDENYPSHSVSGNSSSAVLPLASDPSTAQQKEVTSSVAPLARPSANRANRILEGSMDSSQL